MYTLINMFRPESKLKYFIIQEVRVMVFILFVFLDVSFLLVFPILMKIGVPPFHYWMLEVFWKLKKIEMIYFISITKIFPAIIIMSIIRYIFLFPFIVIFLIIQLSPLIFKRGLKVLLFYSSLTNFIFIFFLRIRGMLKIRWIYLFIYLFLTIWSTSSIKEEGIKRVNFFYLFNVLGMPPSPLFFLKVVSLFLILKSFLLLFFLLIFSLFFYYLYLGFWLKILKIESGLSFLTKKEGGLINLFLLCEVFIFFLI